MRALFLSLLLVPALASAADHHRPMMGTTLSNSNSTREFEASMERMHEGMSIDYSGNTDVDFVRGMIPHHQGAIDMARTELKYGKDAKTKALARSIIKAQEKEIKMMNAWLASHEKAPGEHGHASH